MKRALAMAILFGISASAFAELKIKTTDFKTLFNNQRFSQADVLPWPASYWPYFGGKDGKNGSGINHVPDGQSMSPAQKYDLAFETHGAAARWEESNHTCKGEGKDESKACKTWYGHCNGWTGAALFNPEPSYDQTFTVTNSHGETVEFNYMDIKALLSEAWLDVWASFEGTGMTEDAGAWIFDPESDVGNQPAANDKSVTNYDAYWDVTPRALFFALTNYIGIQKVGLAIDRFTGAEIWNQPVIGYRFLPIEGNVDQPEKRGKKQLYPVTMGVKIYWANDDVAYAYQQRASLHWRIDDPEFSNDEVPDPVTFLRAQDKASDKAVVSRYISFTLFFDHPVEVSKDGTTVISAGRMVGDGVWSHADPTQKEKWYTKSYEKSQLHPDFIWRPDHLTAANFRNPHIDPAKIYSEILHKPMGDFAPR